MAFKLRLRWTKVVLFLLCLAPALVLAYRFWGTTHGTEPDLGVNPLEFVTHATGDWTLRFLLITLAITPLRKLLKQPVLIQYRRMVLPIGVPGPTRVSSSLSSRDSMER